MSEESNTDDLTSDNRDKQPPKKRVKKAPAPKKDKSKKEKEESEPVAVSKKEKEKEKGKEKEKEKEKDEPQDDKSASADESEGKPKKGKSKGSKKRKKLDHPRTIDMILEALENLEEKQGASVQAIKAFIVTNYKVREDMIKSMIKRGLATAIKDNLIGRPKNQESKTQLLSGRYVLRPKKEEDDQPHKPRPSKLRQFTKSQNKKGQKSKKKKKRKGYY